VVASLSNTGNEALVDQIVHIVNKIAGVVKKLKKIDADKAVPSLKITYYEREFLIPLKSPNISL
jgi:hypothetical protein